MPTNGPARRGAPKAPGADQALRVPAASGASSRPGVEGAVALDRRMAALLRIEDRIAEIVRSIPGRIAFSTSLGIEDQALLHAIAASGDDVDVFTLDTGRHFPETLETLEASELRYHRRIRIVVPDAREVEELVARDGIFGFRLAVENR